LDCNYEKDIKDSLSDKFVPGLLNSASVFGHFLCDVYAYENQPYNGVGNQSYQQKAEKAQGQDCHSTWVKPESGPLFYIVTSPGGK